MRKRCKIETKYVNKCSLFCSIFVTFLIFWPLGLLCGIIVWWPPFFKPDFYIFSYNEKLRKIYKKIKRQVFILSHLLKRFIETIRRYNLLSFYIYNNRRSHLLWSWSISTLSSCKTWWIWCSNQNSSKAGWVIMKDAWIPSHRKKEYQID